VARPGPLAQLNFKLIFRIQAELEPLATLLKPFDLDQLYGVVAFA